MNSYTDSHSTDAREVTKRLTQQNQIVCTTELNPMHKGEHALKLINLNGVKLNNFNSRKEWL